MPVKNLFPAVIFHQYKQHRLYKILGLFCAFWLVNSFLSWLYFCRIDYHCYTTRLFAGYLGGIFFWFLAIPVIVDLIRRIKKSGSAFTRKMILLVGTGFILLALNQVFVYKVVEGTYSTLWGYADPNPSWVNEVIANNILINIVFFCMIVEVVWRRFQVPVTKTAPSVAINHLPQSIPVDHLLIKDGSTSHKVDFHSVLYVQVELNCIHIYTQTRKFVLYTSLTRFSQNLPGEIFVQIHRSTIVNRDIIRQVRNLSSGDAEVVLDNGTVLKCSRVYKKKVLQPRA